MVFYMSVMKTRSFALRTEGAKDSNWPSSLREMQVITLGSWDRGAGDALRTQRDPTRVNVKSVPPRLPRNLDDISLNLPRLQPLQRLLNRTKPSHERGLAWHPRSSLRHLSSEPRFAFRDLNEHRTRAGEEGKRISPHLQRSGRRTKTPNTPHSQISLDADVPPASYEW